MERRRVAKEITLVSKSPAPLLAMMTCVEGKRLYHWQIVEVVKPRSGRKKRKEKEKDR